MHHLLRVHIPERIANLRQESYRQRFAYLFAGQQAVQCLAVHPFHFDAAAQRRDAHKSVVFADVLMLQAVADLELLAKQTLVDRISHILSFQRLVDSEPTVPVGTPEVAVTFRITAYQLEGAVAEAPRPGGSLEKSGRLVHKNTQI